MLVAAFMPSIDWLSAHSGLVAWIGLLTSLISLLLKKKQNFSLDKTALEP
jgi:hypothetical protein